VGIEVASGAVGFVARHNVRRRRRSLLVITIVVGLVGTIVLATAAGARRTATSLERFESSSRTATVELTMLGRPTRHQLAALHAVPHVAASATLRAYALMVPGAPELETIGAPLDRQSGTTVDRPRIVRGRAPHPSAPNEIAIGEALADRLHVGPGDPLRVATQSPQQVNAILDGAVNVGPPAGPVIVLQIVGVQRRPLDLGDRAAIGGFLVLSPAFDSTYAGRVGRYGSYLRIRTDAGTRDVAPVIAASRRIFGKPLFSAQALNIETKGAGDAIDVLALALWIFAAATAFGGVVAIAIVLSRELDELRDQQDVLTALGLTRTQRMAVCGAPAAPVAIGGGLLAVFGAIAASPLFPFGVARRADPDVGIHVDLIVTVLGVVAVVGVVMVVAIVAAVRATRRTSADAARSRPSGRSTVAQLAAERGLAPPVVNGVRMAFQRGGDRTSVPVRSALMGAVVGVLGITAVMVFSASLQQLVATPRDYGWTWDFQTRDTTSNAPCGSKTYGLARQRGVSAVSELCFQNVQADGHPVGGLSFRHLSGGSIGPQVLEGRAPQGPHEVALGTSTMDALGKGIGDTIHVRRRDVKRDFRVVGRVVFPTLGLQPLADGVAFTGAGFAPLFDSDLFSRYFVGRYSPNVDRRAVATRIGRMPELSRPVGATVPVEIERIRQISWVPVGLSLLFGGLALFAIGFVIVTGARRRRRELVLLKTLGFERRQVRATIAWQATTLTVLGLAVGIPLGAVFGNLVWGFVADGLGVSAPTVVPVLALTAVIGGALVIVNLLAFLPAVAAARAPIGRALRSE
jgi:hypothetical protein